jgi:hypothetical protein
MLQFAGDEASAELATAGESVLIDDAFDAYLE